MANMTSPTNSDPKGSKQDKANGIVARATEDAASIASDGVRRTRARFDEQVSKQREQVTGRVRTLGRALRGAGEMLEEDNVVAHGLHYASDKVNHVAGYIEEVNPKEVVEDLRNVARRHPLWFFGSAFTLGLALSRFARSTSGTTREPAQAPRPAATSGAPSRASDAKAGAPASGAAGDGATKRNAGSRDESETRAGTTPRRGPQA